MIGKERNIKRQALLKLLLEECRDIEDGNHGISRRSFKKTVLEHIVHTGVRYKRIIKSCPILNVMAKKVYHFILKRWL